MFRMVFPAGGRRRAAVYLHRLRHRLSGMKRSLKPRKPIARFQDGGVIALGPSHFDAGGGQVFEIVSR